MSWWVFVVLALMFGESTPTTSEPALEYVSVTVMMNSAFAQGRGPGAAPCMVLFDLDQPGPVSRGKLQEMQRVAKEVYSIYAGDSPYLDDPTSRENAEMADFIAHLSNDMYLPHNRKAVPSLLANGRRLYVSDIMLHRSKFDPSGRLPKVAMVKVTGESRGTIHHIPWNDSLVLTAAAR